MTSCFELYSVFIHTNPPFAVLGDDVGLKVLGDEDGERVGLAMEISTIAELDWQYLVMMLGSQLGSKYLKMPTVNVWGLQMEISMVFE